MAMAGDAYAVNDAVVICKVIPNAVLFNYLYDIFIIRRRTDLILF